MRRYWPYPLKHFLRHPILVSIVLFDYELRRRHIRPDGWHWADALLSKKVR